MLKSGNKKPFTSHFVFRTEMIRYRAKKVRYNAGMTSFRTNVVYPASRGFSLGWLLAFTKSFAWLACRVVSLFMPREKQGGNKLTTRQTSHANDFVNAKSRAREKPLLAGEMCVTVSLLSRDYYCLNAVADVSFLWFSFSVDLIIQLTLSFQG